MKLGKIYWVMHAGIFLILCGTVFAVSRTIISQTKKLELTVLDRLRPSTFRHLCPHPDLRHLKVYEVYFQKVNDQFKGSLPDVNGMVGYCAYYRGDLKKSVESYQKALSINPHFFWYYYNLAVIYFQQKNYKDSQAMIDQALKLDLRETLFSIMSSSKVYMPLIKDYLPSLEGATKQFQEGTETLIRLAIAMHTNTESLGDSHEMLMCY
jgi:tetratricopeptide (TPR) repeat protein